MFSSWHSIYIVDILAISGPHSNTAFITSSFCFCGELLLYSICRILGRYIYYHPSLKQSVRILTHLLLLTSPNCTFRHFYFSTENSFQKLLFRTDKSTLPMQCCRQLSFTVDQFHKGICQKMDTYWIFCHKGTSEKLSQ